MKSSFTPMSLGLVAMVVSLFIYSYLFTDLLVGAIGVAILVYLVYRRLDFRSLVRSFDPVLRRTVLEDVVHRLSPVSIKVEVSGMENVSVQGVEKVPERFELHSGDTLIDGIPRRDHPIRKRYSLIPLERGHFRIPPLDLKLKDSRSLFETDISLDGETQLFVRPSREEIRLAHLMGKRKQFEITGPANRRHTRTFRADFRTIRDYIPGDRFRDIDWKATSRLTKLMTREYELETNLPTMLLLDTSLSMREMIRRRSKLDHAIALAIQIAIVMDDHHHPVGLITFDENRVIEHFSPGKNHIDDIVLSIFKLPNPIETAGYPGPPSPSGIEGEDGGSGFLNSVGPFLVNAKKMGLTRDRATGIFQAVREIDSREETGLLLVVVTDLETNPGSIMKALQLAVKRKHRVVLVSPFSWPYHLNKQDLNPELLEKVYADYQRKQSMIGGLRANGIRVIEIGSTEKGENVLSGLRRLSQ